MVNGLNLIVPEDRQRGGENLLRLLSGKMDGPVEYQGLRKDGSTFPMHFHISPVKEGEQIVGFSGVAVDITERVRAEDELRESKLLLSESQKISHVGSWRLDVSTQELLWSDEVYRIFGLEPQEFPGTHAAFMNAVHPEDRDAVDHAYSSSIQDGRDSYEIEHRVIRKSTGEVRHVHEKCIHIRDSVGTMLWSVGMVQDITSRVQLDEERNRLEEQHREALKMEAIGRLAGGVAHDFNNLLTVINSYAEFAADGLRDDDPMKADIEQIRIAGDRATALTRQLLAFGRKQLLEPKSLDMNKVIVDLENTLSRLIGDDIEYSATLRDGLERVTADPGQLEQVFMNLALNARDAMPRGGKLTLETTDVELDVAYASRHADALAGHYVMLAVSDNGVGMTPEVAARIFDPFYTTKESGSGTGLGLATVYGIIRQSGGHISVHSVLGQGTTFKVYLPRAEPDETTQQGGRGVGAVGLRGSETILVVEDEDGVRRLARRILESSGYTVITAANGGDALLAWEQHGSDIHLVLTDVMMPKMGGKELADRLAEISQDLKVIFMSGYTEDAIGDQGVLDADTQFIAKPFNPPDLLSKIRRVLDSD